MNQPASRTSSPIPIDRARLDAVIDPVARAHGAEVFDLEFKNEQGGWVLRVYVEKLGSHGSKAKSIDAAVTLDLCSNVARDLSPALDVADVIPHRYHLEVSSPGIERPLRREGDFVRFAGEKAKLKLHNAIKGQKVLVGILGDVTNGVLVLREGIHAHKIPLEEISAARLVFEFGPQPKPGKVKKAHPMAAKAAAESTPSKSHAKEAPASATNVSATKK